MVRITWLKPEERIVHEFAQLREQGLDAGPLEARWLDASEESGADRRTLALTLLDEAGALSDAQPGLEPEVFLASLPEDPPGQTPPPGVTSDRILGAWTGRVAGCLLGKPVEKVPRAGIRAILESNGEWPLSRYFTAEGVPEAVTARYPWNRASRPTSLRENIVCMPEDDDVNYTMLNLHVLETYGDTFSTDDVATVWLERLPVLTVFTAERVAYENLLAYVPPPHTARVRNPYREWIGAQIRGDIFGLVSPGAPRRAATLALRDARLSHTENGVYGEMFVAATLAAAFTTTDPRRALEQGLAVVPPPSRLAEALRFALSLPAQTPDWEEAFDLLYARYGHLHWVHTINNAALVAAALLYGEGDFGRSVALAVIGGWDTDSNGATVGAVVGTLGGSAAIPEAWSAPLGDRIRSSLKGFDHASITDLARRTAALLPGGNDET